VSSVQHLDECVIQWWHGYVKSSFYVLVDGSSPDERTLIESPLFWSLGKETLAPDGPAAAAHRQLVETLERQGWQADGVGESWYEQRFVRAAPEPVAGDECVIRRWQGYVKSSFYVLVDGSSPDERTLIESPLFWSFGKQELTPEGDVAAAHEQLVEQLTRQGWRPDGVDASWYEQRFVRKARARTADEPLPAPAPAEAAPATRQAAPKKPARAGSADDRALRVVEKTAPPAPPPASTAPARPAAPESPPPERAPTPVPRSGTPRPASKQAKAPSRSGSKQPVGRTSAAKRPSQARAAGPRHHRGASVPGTLSRSSRRRARARRFRQLAPIATVVAWLAVVTAAVAGLIIALGGL
jgi:hypothetical protein